LAGGGWSTIFITAVLLACTIIGIPFAWAHVKVAGLAIAQLRAGGNVKKSEGVELRPRWRLNFRNVQSQPSFLR
jgi:uncharacterized membrane protein YccF (DUF307 family)